MLRIVSHILSLSIALIFIISLCACGGKNTGDTTTPDTSPAPEVTGIIINEYCCKNTNIIYDSEGDYCDWVELYNTTDSSFSLAKYFLSDDEADTKKWAFPDNTVIEPKAFLLVFLSGKNRLGENGEIHASFKLGGDDEKILLLNNRGKTVDALEIMDLKENTSYGRSLDASQYFFFARPTPGAQNNTTGFT
ncbi:MAG TPA: lamin tail domain-containing protein, partial [Clostridiales bacterium]|nr:lamin tail domain-containing protein [Clostridiales bacterium]